MDVVNSNQKKKKKSLKKKEEEARVTLTSIKGNKREHLNTRHITYVRNVRKWISWS